MRRFLPALTSVASIFLFATCDFDKISGTPKPITAADVARLFSIGPVGDTLVTLGAGITLTIVPGTGVDLGTAIKRWYSSDTNRAKIDSITGAVTGRGIGPVVITARVSSPELDTGYVRTRSLRVRYQAIRVAALDSLPAKGFARAVVVNGTNAANVVQPGAVTGATLSAHDTGSTSSTFVSLIGSSVVGRANGVAYVVALLDNLRDSVKVKVRQVAKTLAFPTVDYGVTAMNFDRRLPLVLQDVNDSTMVSSAAMRWRTSDTSVVTIDSLTGVFRVKKRDTARIFVRVDTVTEKSQRLFVQQLVGSMAKVSGDNFTDTVAQHFLGAVTVSVLDSGNTPVSGAAVTFRSGPRRSFLSDSVTLTGGDGRATLGTWRLGDSVGTYSVIASTGSVSTTFTATAVHGRPFAALFLEFPAGVAPGATMGAVRVSIVDSLGNVVPTATHQVTLALADNPAGGTLSGTKTATAVNGVATFNDLSLDNVGAGYKLSSTATGLAGSTSGPIGVFGAPARLAFIEHPITTTGPNQPIPNSVRVAIQDDNGITVTNSSVSVTMAIGNNNAGATLSGQTSRAAVNGIATFPGLALNASANNYTLNANSAGLIGASSLPFNVAGPKTKLQFVIMPSNSTAGASFTVQVFVMDAANNRVEATDQITITRETGPAAGTLAGITVQGAEAGVAEFSTLRFDKSGSYTLRASASGLTSAVSGALVVAPAPASLVAITAQPTGTGYLIRFVPTVTVEIRDPYGNIVTGAPTPVTMAIGSNPGAAMLDGTTTVTAQNGVASFPNLALNAAGVGYTLNASAPGLAAATSTSFSVTGQPGEVTSFNTQLNDMIRLGDTIYFTTNTTIAKVAAIGRDTITFATNPAPRTITSDGVNIYWGDNGTAIKTGSIRKYSPATGQTTILASGLDDLSDQPRTLQTDGARVYFQSWNDAGTAKAIRSVPINGGAVTDHHGSTSNIAPSYFVSGGNIYYWAGDASEIRRVPVAGGAATTIATSNAVYHYAMIGSTLYVDDANNLWSIPNADTHVGAPMTPTLRLSHDNLWQLAAKDGLLYGHFNGTIRRYNPSNFTIGTVIGGPGTVYSLPPKFTFDDSGTIYYKHGNGRIMKAAK